MINIFRKWEKEKEEWLKDGKFPQIIVIHKNNSSTGNYSFWQEEIIRYFNRRLYMAEGNFKGQEERSKSYFKTGTGLSLCERRTEISEKSLRHMWHRVKRSKLWNGCLRWGTKDSWGWWETTAHR